MAISLGILTQHFQTTPDVRWPNAQGLSRSWRHVIGMLDGRLLPTCDWSQGWGGFFILMIGWCSLVAGGYSLQYLAAWNFCYFDCDGSRSRAMFQDWVRMQSHWHIVMFHDATAVGLLLNSIILATQLQQWHLCRSFSWGFTLKFHEIPKQPYPAKIPHVGSMSIHMDHYGSIHIPQSVSPFDQNNERDLPCYIPDGSELGRRGRHQQLGGVEADD